MDKNRKTIDFFINSISVAFGKEIIQKREKLGLSRMQLARKALMSYKWLHAIERGQKNPSLYIIGSISIALDSHDWNSLKPMTSYGYHINGSVMYLSYINPPKEDGNTEG